jgi:hypothetical protein
MLGCVARVNIQLVELLVIVDEIDINATSILLRENNTNHTSFGISNYLFPFTPNDSREY